MARNVLSRVLRSGGTTLPVPWPSLASKIEPEPGHLVNVIGAPGVGKSLFGLAWAYGTGRPSLVISLDTDLRSQALRVVAMLRDLPVEDVKDDPDTHSRWLAKKRLPVRWSDAPISADDVGELLEAEQEYVGVIPEMVLVDSVGDLTKEESYEEYVHVFSQLHKAAKKYETVVVALHHLKSGTAFDGNKPVSLNESLYSGQKQAEIVLGIWRPTDLVLKVGVLKNRMGAADRLGQYYAELACDLSRAQIRAYTDAEEYKRQVGLSGTQDH